jgi:hypothetical protein
MEWFAKLSSEAQVLILFQLCSSLISIGCFIATLNNHGRRLSKLEDDSQDHGENLAKLNERTGVTHERRVRRVARS